MELDRDKILIGNLIKGKENAFEEIYETYWEDLYSYVARILNQEPEVEDIVQEVFVKLWRIKDKLSHINSLKAYLFVMAKNSVIKHVSKKRNQVTYGECIEEFAKDMYTDLEQEIHANQLSTIIDIEVASLPNKMQQIFLLSRKQQLSHKEIAELLEISDQTVKKQVNNTLKLLRQRLKKIV